MLLRLFHGLVTSSLLILNLLTGGATKVKCRHSITATLDNLWLQKQSSLARRILLLICMDLMMPVKNPPSPCRARTMTSLSSLPSSSPVSDPTGKNPQQTQNSNEKQSGKCSVLFCLSSLCSSFLFLSLPQILSTQNWEQRFYDLYDTLKIQEFFRLNKYK